MGDNVDSKNYEGISSDNRDIVSSSSDIVATVAVSVNVEDNIQTVSDSCGVSISSSEAGGAVTCAAALEVDASNSDTCVCSSSSDVLPSKGFHEEPDSTNSVVEVTCKENIVGGLDSPDPVPQNSCKDIIGDSPHSADSVLKASCNDVADDDPDSADCVLKASCKDVNDGPDSMDSLMEAKCRDLTDDCPDAVDSVLGAICKDSADNGNLPYDDSIMDVCSTAAQQIKRTITEALKSRESVSEKLLEPDDFCFSLEANLKEKITDFEKTVEKTNSPTKESGDSSLSTTCISSEQGGDSSNSEISHTEIDVKKTTETPSDMYTNSDATTSVPVQKWSSEVIETKSSSHTETLFIVPEVSGDTEKSKKNQKSSAVKKKGEKSVDQILKSLGNFSSPDEKLLTLCRKHIEVLEDLRSNETRLKQCERQAVVTLREKEQLQADHNRTILAKSRLESLCRELQRQNKAVKEESLLRIREEEEKRKDVSSKFQMTLTDISNLMQDNSKKNLQLREENAELAKKLKSLVEHYEMWEKHMGKVLQQKDLEVQLAKAKLAKTNLQLKQETEKFLREKKDLLENMSELQKKCTELASNEVQLRTELGVYTAKYEEFQTVLNKSNQVFASFKTDMDTTSKKIKKLEKETNLWKTKWENSNGALLEMIADKQKRDKELLNAQQRVLMLEKLCRALQAERNDLQSQVKGLSNTDSTISSNEEFASAQ